MSSDKLRNTDKDSIRKSNEGFAVLETSNGISENDLHKGFVVLDGRMDGYRLVRTKGYKKLESFGDL